jgi:hypothetical protein
MSHTVPRFISNEKHIVQFEALEQTHGQMTQAREHNSFNIALANCLACSILQIFSYVSKGDWNAVIKETTLPLKYRVEVALRWLPDDELLGDFCTGILPVCAVVPLGGTGNRHGQ